MIVAIRKERYLFPARLPGGPDFLLSIKKLLPVLSSQALYAEQLVWDDELQRLEKLARYVTRGLWIKQVLHRTHHGKILLSRG